MINLENVSKSYDKVIIDNFSYRFENGKKYLLKGKNGIGKTTLIRLITSLEKADKGLITVEGKISYSPQNSCLLDYYNPIDNIAVFSKKNKTIIKEQLADFFDNSTMLLNCCHLSGGQKQIVSVLRSMISDSATVILDEPFNNLDENSIKKLADYLNSHLNNRTLIIVSHYLSNIDFTDYIQLDLDQLL
ncbi:MAG: ATP-binding cassette domain-containing protein [Erysipelotrichaceae bacterium]